ncbi:MAG: ribbon-helix-helix domain-containing protein [Solirubrobacterales bacterium]|nr:ribbon-helix-helix domain-containing protein [Solirubrobacterales bacterium]
MQKTTVYLDEGQAERLGRLSDAVGRSRAELIREGVEHVLESAPPRTFHSMGKGHGGGAGGPRRWDAEGLHRKVRAGRAR